MIGGVEEPAAVQLVRSRSVEIRNAYDEDMWRRSDEKFWWQCE
jgi:hypothetical protein